VIKVAGVCDIVIKKDGKDITIIENVLYVPGMKCNLLSVGQLLEKGFSVIMQKNMLKVYDARRKMVLKSPLSRNRTFQTRLYSIEQHCLAATVTDKLSWLWHKRFAHLGFNSLEKLAAKSMMIGLPEVYVPQKICEECLKGKQPRNAFNSHIHKWARGFLHVVYYDMCGPFEKPLLGRINTL